GARRAVAGVRLLRPGDRSGRARGRHRDLEGRRSARRLDAREAVRAEAGLQGGRQGHGRQLVPAERRSRGRARAVGDASARAAGVLVMSDTRASELGLKPRARIIASATAANEPEYMGVAPIWAIKKVLERAGMSIEDVDTVELNEAFAAQLIPIMAECGIPLEKMNPHGGAIALGH